jgi:hypothetical protein
MRQPLALVVSVLVALAVGAATASAAGTITTVAGPGTAGTSGDGGPATQAYMAADVGVTALADGSFLVAHQAAAAVRHVSPDGTITTIAGNGTPGYSGDGGPATQAQLDGVSKAVPAPGGGYLIADPNNNAIRRVAPDGTITTVAGMPPGSGTGTDGVQATSSFLSFPYDVAFLPDGSFLIADENNARVRRVDTSGNISTVAGGGSVLGDGGPATAAQLQKPRGVTVTPDGYLIADWADNRIRKVTTADGKITTVAGTGAAGDTGDGGPATAAQLNQPVRTALEPDGGFLIAEIGGDRVRRVAPDGTISTIAGTGTAGFSGDGGPATAAELNDPYDVSVLPSNDILIADATNGRVRFVDEDTPPPTLTSTSPASPSTDPNPRVFGSAPAGTSISLFTDGTCSGAPISNGLAADLANLGIPVAVPAGSTTVFNAVDVDAGGFSSACSSTSVTYQRPGGSLPPLPKPVIGVSANAVPVKGTVLVKVPGHGFVPLASLGRHIPVGSTIDTTRGTVSLTTAKSHKGAVQFGKFSRGIFKFTQTKKNPLTTLSMTGAGLDKCSRLPAGGARKPVLAARKRRRTLFSDVKGRFRTRGRNSAATVRGTQWTMTDTCAGTLTIVKRGSVVVRDYTLRKNRTLKTGQRYLAKPPPLVHRRGNR